MGVTFHENSSALVGIIMLGLALISISQSTAADEGTAKKSEDWRKRLEMLRSVPYVDFSETEVEEADTGLVFYNQGKAYDGYNLYSMKKWFCEVYLLDMLGQVVHRWRYYRSKGAGKFAHAVLLDNGDLLVLNEYKALLRLNWDSQLIWRKELAAHHDVVEAPDGSLYVIVNEHKSHREIGVNFDAIVHLTAHGEEIDSWSSYDHLAEIKSVLDTRSFLDTILDNALGGRSKGGDGWREFKRTVAGVRYKSDYFHANTVNVLPATPLGEKDSRFREGNLLVCFRNVNQIAVIEKDTYRVLWSWGEGELDWPHHPTMLENGHILIFDNGVQRKYSRVVELDPADETIVWEYKEDPPENFYSWVAGSSQRLPNGNTLICESDKGRTFEVTTEGQVVWTWLHPVTSERRRAVLYRMLRLPAARVARLLTGWWWWE